MRTIGVFFVFVMQADHCAALALIALDEPGEAATRLDILARRSDAGTLTERAKLLAEAGNAWLLASQPANAEVALSAALKLTPRDPELWTDRARARAAQMNWDDAEQDLSNALTFDAAKPEVFVLRAAARKAQGNSVGYKFDVDAALALDPTYPEALVERGIMKQEAGDVPGARERIDAILATPFRTADLHATAAKIYRAAGDEGRASEEEERARAIHPQANEELDWLTARRREPER